MSLSINHLGMNYHNPIGGGHWGSEFGSCCRKILGPRNRGLMGAVLGGLVGTIMGGGNPIMGLLGLGLGGLIGGQMGGHQCGQYANHQHPHHQNASCYPPQVGHHFGGPQYGGYQSPTNYGNSPFGQPQWCPPQQHNPNMNFDFGHHCPPSSCCHCPCPGQPNGQLQQDGKGKPIEYTTSGGYKVQVNKHTISVTDPSGKNVLKHWGDPHENLNGKHLKDWQSKQRSVVLGDGTKITMSADGPKGVTLNTSIYDGRQNIQIDNKQNEIKHHSFNPYDTMYRERSQYDGETALFTTNRNGAGVYNNIYQEDKNFGVTSLYQALGRTGGYQNPNKVYDFFDDPTHSRT